MRLREAKTFAKVRTRLRTYAEAYPERPWIIGSEFSYGYSDMPEGGFHKSFLDEIVSDRPVFFRSGMAHAAWVNSKALELAGIGRDTPDPEGGEVVRDAAGEPTGWLKEKAWSQIEGLLPEYSSSDVQRALARAIALANRLGLTRAKCRHGRLYRPYLADMAKRGELTLRLTLSNIVHPDSGVDEIIARVAAWRDDLDRHA